MRFWSWVRVVVVAGGAHLPFVQRSDHRRVAELGLADHRLGELHLCCDVGH